MSNQRSKSLWLFAFIGAAVVAVAAIVVAIVLALSNQTPPPEEPSYYDGEAIGVYYYEVADGDVMLTISKGNVFTLAGPSINKTGTYTVDANGNIVLDFVRDEDGTATATINGTDVSLTIGESTMSFTKMVSYTVSFNTQGGNDITAATVLNGQTVNKPQDPTKAGNVFLGWYADEAFTAPFDFASSTITANTTLYARWAQEQVGGKFQVTLDLGYEGAEQYDAFTTVAGIAYGIPTPDRSGYTFGGWWISMYEDGSKLTYEYTEDTVFTADTTLFALWYEDAATKLQAPKVSIEGNRVAWNANSAAQSYTVVITNENGDELFRQTVGATYVNFDFAAQPAGNYAVSVVANAAVTANSSDAAVRYLANKTLPRVSQFEVIDGILIFKAVDGATSYEITIDCGNDNHEHTSVNLGASTSFSLINCPMQAGGINVTVIAKANGYASSSATYAYERTLGAIPSVVYNAANDTFIWDAIAGASSYTVTVTVGTETFTFNNGTKTSFSVADYTGEISVSITPVNAGFNSPAATVATCTKVAPAAPNGLTVNGMIVSWNAPFGGADSYEIKIGEIIKTTTETSLDLTDVSGLAAGNWYAISVKAVKGAESSAYTAPVSIGYGVMNPNLTYANGTISWIPAIGISNYQVRVNGDDSKIYSVSGVTSMKITLTREGENLIEVRYTDGIDSEWVSITVTAYAVRYMPRNTEGERVEYLAIGDTMTLPRDFTYGGYDFADWYTSPTGAAGNGTLYATGSTFNAQSSIVLYADWTPKTYNAILWTEGYEISNIEDKSEIPAVYTKDFTLPIPAINDPELYVFAGWYTQPSGAGVQLTDAEGNSVAGYAFKDDQVAYPYFRVVFTYVLQPDETYGVKKGPDFGTVTEVTVPTTYKSVPVTVILENAFLGQKNLQTIHIPNTIKYVGIGAFTDCNSLAEIDVYTVEGTHEIFYSSDDGALLHYDLDKVYLEAFPRAKTGTYTMSDDVQYITSNAFKYAKISEIIIGKGVVNIAKNAFYLCTQLERIEFAEGRTAPVNIEDEAFRDCNHVTYIKLPKSLTMAGEGIVAALDRLRVLETIEVESGNSSYNSVNGMLTTADRTEILYAPRNLKLEDGVFTVPNGVRKIATGAFTSCTSIKKIIIPAFVREIGNQAFSVKTVYDGGDAKTIGCLNVSEIVFLGNRINDLTIGTQAFAGSTALTSVVFEGNATRAGGAITIGASAFVTPTGVTSKLTSLVFKSGVNIALIGQSAFANHAKLPAITVEDGATITEIGASAFSGCASLTAINIPASVTKIGNNAFANCAGIVSVSIPETEHTMTLGSGVFQNCENLRTVSLPSSVSGFTGATFSGCLALREITIAPDHPELYSENGIIYNSAKTKLMFYPKGLLSANGYAVNNILPTVTELDASVFEASEIVSITLPAGLTKIGNKAFASCTLLTTVTFSTEGTAATSLEIGTSAFSGCNKLVYGYTTTTETVGEETVTKTTGIVLPAYTTKIGSSAFANCKFASFTIPAGVTTISDSAFSANTNLASIEIPLNVTTIGNGAFAGCTKLATVTFAKAGEGQTAANVKLGGTGTGVFNKCTALKSVDLGDRVTVIGKGTFEGCTNAGFTSIDLGTKLTQIGDNAFKSVKLTSVVIPNTVTEIGAGAFAATSFTAEGLTFQAGNDTAGLKIAAGAFTGQATVTKVILPARTSQLGSNAATTLSGKVKGYDTYKCFDGMTALTTIEVATSENASFVEKFSASEGVLYRNDATGVPTILLFCPAKNAGTNNAITVPKTVTLVSRSALVDISVLTTINFENYATTDPEYGQPLLTFGEGTVTSTTNLTKYAVVGGHLTSTSTSNMKNSITAIHFPSHLGFIGSGAIGQTAANLTVTFEGAENVTLSEYVFYNSKITSIDIPGVVALGTKATFSGCKSATSISFGINGDALTAIPDTFFESCSALLSVTIPAEIQTIGASAFKSCTALTSVNFETGSQLKTIKSSAFSGCKALTSIDLSPCTLLERLGEQGIPGVTGMTVSDTGDIFANCSALTSINLSACTNLTYIGGRSFSGCTALTSFTFPESVVTVGTDLFKNCTSLVTVNLHTGFTPSMICSKSANGSSAYGMFFGCTALQNIVVPTGNIHLVADEFGAIYDPAYTTIYVFPAGAALTKTVEGVEKTFSLPTTVKTISPYAFAFYTGTSITLHEGIETIDDYAFYCNKFTSLTIPASVKTIGTAAIAVDNTLTNAAGTKFNTSYESVLQTVEFASGSQLESIGTYAFYKAVALTSINLPDSVATIGEYAFAYCESLTSIVVPAALKELTRSVFQYDEKLTSITLQEGLEVIGNNAFAYLSTTVVPEAEYGIISINIPNTVTTIGGTAFDYNARLGAVNFTEHSQLTQIGASLVTGGTAGYTFRGTKIKSIVLPPLLESMNSIFYTPPTAKNGASVLETVVFTGTALKSLPNLLFRDCEALVSVTLPEGLESIGNNVFSNSENSNGRPNFKSITIPASVKTIGTGAFAGCIGLETVIFEDGSQIAEIGNNTFRNTTSLTSINLPDTITKIGTYAFANSAITAINLTTALESIGEHAFDNCDNLVSANLLGNLKTLGDYAFYDCDKLTNAMPSSGLEYFGALAFSGCELLEEGYIPDTVTELAGNPYAGCTNVNLTVSDDNQNYKTVGGALYDAAMTTLIYYPATILDEVAVIPDTIRVIADGAFNGASMKSITIPARLGTIGDNMFQNCKNLETVTIVDGITAIGAYAFEGCSSLTSIAIPESVSSIGNYAFANCVQLNSVTYGEKTGGAYYTIGTHVFDGCTAMTSVFLPNAWRISNEDAIDCGLGSLDRLSGQYTYNETACKGNIPSYMFANTGIVNAVIPTAVTDLATKGVFMNCAGLTSVTFQKSGFKYTTMGTNYFTGCPNFDATTIPKGSGGVIVGPGVKPRL